MSEKGLTAISLKKINRSKVYRYIYKSKQTSKMQIVSDLQMGLSTVSQNLTTLESDGLIERNGSFDSTGGRKAQAIRIVSEYRISIGVGILKDMFHLVAVDLYGTVLCDKTENIAYCDTQEYYSLICDSIVQFITENNYKEKQILGVSIATQGITSLDNSSVIYGNIMGNTGMNINDFSSRLSYPCRLEHDSKAAAFLEMWNRPELESAVVLLLNQNLGGAIITNRQIHHGSTMHSGTFEHICINPTGPLCYCGNHGCLETYCSANALKQNAHMELTDFFSELRNNPNSSLSDIWKSYLKNLAFAIKNLNLIIDAPVIISGYIAPFLNETDIDSLLDYINRNAVFLMDKSKILLGTHGQYTQAVGAALYYTDSFINEV